MASNSVLAKMAVQISANTAEFNKAISQTNSKLDAFSKNVSNIAQTVGIAFGLQQIGAFTLEVSRLAGEVKGVRTAFDKFKDSERLLENLKRATAGTVSELELMKRATQAANFGISLEALPKLLEFASVRAQQTGQSVDYLVDSIVTGIGRKSPLILDNLGISAVALKEKLNGVSLAAASVGDIADAVGKIAAESLEKTGAITETSATQMARFSAEVENLKAAIGLAINDTNQFSNSISVLNDTVILLTDFFNSDAIKVIGVYSNAITDVATLGIPKLYAELKRLLKGNDEVNESLEKTTQSTKEAVLPKVEFEKTTFNIATLEKQINETLKARKELTGIELLNANKRLKSLQDLKKELEELGVVQKNLAPKPQTLDPFSGLSLTPSGNGQINSTGILPFQSDVAGYLEDVKETADTFISYQELMAQRTRESQELIRKQWELSAANAEQLGVVIGDSFSGALTNEQSFAQGLARITETVVQQYGRQAIAAIIAKAAKTGGPFPFVAVAAAAAGVAAISGLLRSAAGYKGRGGGGRGGFGNSSSFSNFAQDTAAVGIRVDDMVIRGQDLYVMMSTYNRNNRSTGNG